MPGTRSLLAIATAAALAIAVPFVAPEIAPALTRTPAATATATPTSEPTTTPTSDAATTSAQAALTTDGSVTSDLARGVVLIETTTTSGNAAGTGMVLTSDGQILTNYHVVNGSLDISVTIASTGQTYQATVIGHDATKDVALLQLEDASGLDTVTLDADTLAVGDALVAVGNANGGGELVSATGVVTALEQQVTVSGEEGTETLTGVIETDAGAVPGDSGGPMYDAEGEVTGMTTAGGTTVVSAPGGRRRTTTVETETTAYAVPISDAMAVVEQIRTGHESGTVEIGANAYIGVSVSDGLVVVGVAADSGAADAGITEGSTITAADGSAISTQAELADVLAGLTPTTPCRSPGSRPRAPAAPPT